MLASTAKLLENAGWNPGRRIEVKPLEQALLKCGFELLPDQHHFLSEFGGLNVAINPRCVLTFDVIGILDNTLEFWYPDEVGYCENAKRFGVRWSPVGALVTDGPPVTLDDATYVFMMTDAGSVYAIAEWYVGPIGHMEGSTIIDDLCAERWMPPGKPWSPQNI